MGWEFSFRIHLRIFLSILQILEEKIFFFGITFKISFLSEFVINVFCL